MTIDPAVAFVALAAAAAMGAIVIWVFLRGRIPPAVAEMLAQAVAEIGAVLGETFTEDDLAALAGWFYDNWLQGSEYYSREEFIALIERAVLRSRKNAPVIRASIARSVGQAVER